MTQQNYLFHLEHYMTPSYFERIKAFSKDKETPFLIIDIDKIKNKYNELKHFLPSAKIYYAMKANPHSEVIKCLYELGSNFDIASRYELNQLLELGVSTTRISYGNTIKKKKDIQYAYEKGVRLFVTDSLEDLQNLSQYAPGSNIFFRIIAEGTGADWPLSRKFGAYPDMIYTLILTAKELDLNPIGVSFHVGSQQHDIGQWDDAIAKSKYLFDSVKKEGINLKMLNLGGGFPAHYHQPIHPIEIYAKEIMRFLKDDFEENLPELILEPGRYIAAESGVLVSEIIQINKKSENNLYRWVFLDVGIFNGLTESLNESIKYPIFFDKEGETEKIILAGPTCDSIDILYENYKCKMPCTSKSGDRVYILSTGAYTQTYSTIGFNGFPPLRAYILE